MDNVDRYKKKIHRASHVTEPNHSSQAMEDGREYLS